MPKHAWMFKGNKKKIRFFDVRKAEMKQFQRLHPDFWHSSLKLFLKSIGDSTPWNSPIAYPVFPNLFAQKIEAQVRIREPKWPI